MTRRHALISTLALLGTTLMGQNAHATSFKDLHASQTGTPPTIEVKSNGAKWYRSLDKTLTFKLNGSGKVKCLTFPPARVHLEKWVKCMVSVKRFI